MKENGKTRAVQASQRWTWGLIGALVALQLIAPSRVWLALLIALGGLVGFAYLWARQMAARVAVTRKQRYGWAHTGDLLEEQFELRNNSFLPVLWVEIDDHSDLPSYSARTVRSADPHSVIAWRSEGICERRGLFTLGPWQARLSDPFGFFRVTLDYPDSRSFLVYPPVVHLPMLSPPRGTAAGAGRISRHALELTTEAAGIRPYDPGDSQGRIHWRSTARRDSLMVKTFDLEPSGGLWIILDLDSAVQAGQGEESTEEYGVILASSLADRALREEGRAVGLAAYGAVGSRGPSGITVEPLPTIVLPEKGRAHQWRILQALALVRAGGHWPLARVLAEMDRNLGRGMSLVVITPSSSAEWLPALLPAMRRGVAPSVVLLDAASFGGKANVPALRGVLADLGIPSHCIAKGEPFRPVVDLSRQRIGRPELRVLPGTGRVIVVNS